MGKPNARERILEAAGELFHQHGYANVGINEIIKQAETAKASFYQHFESKEALCEAWLESIHERSEKRRFDVIGQDLTAAQKLSLYFDQMATYLVEGEFRGCPYNNTCAMVDTDRVMRQVRSHKVALRGFFQALVEQEHGPVENAGELGNQIFLVYSGAVTEAQNSRELWPVESGRAAALTLLSSLGKR